MGETDLRDAMAVERTHLANERTFLAYIRTSLALSGRQRHGLAIS